MDPISSTSMLSDHLHWKSSCFRYIAFVFTDFMLLFFCVSTSKYILQFTWKLVDLYCLYVENREELTSSEFLDTLPKQWRMETLAQLEALCERLYNSQDSVERAHAESTLKCFSSNADYISQCQYVLDNTSSPYALMLASSSLLKQVTEKNLPLQLRIDIRNIFACFHIIITRNILGDLFVHFPNLVLPSVISA